MSNLRFWKEALDVFIGLLQMTSSDCVYGLSEMSQLILISEIIRGEEMFHPSETGIGQETGKVIAGPS